MSHAVCPSWMGYVLANPLRRIGHNPDRILAPYVTAGMKVLEIGPAMGFFTLPLARRVGPAGRIVCTDVQAKMIDGLRKRAAKAGVADRIDARLCEPASLGIGDLAGGIDFVLAFAVVHEVPDARRLFAEIVQAMKPGARGLVAEPKMHISTAEFEQTLAAASAAGLRLDDRPRIWGCRAAVLRAG